MTTTRVPSLIRIANRSRKLLRSAERWERRRDEAIVQATQARDDLAAIHSAACERFGRDILEDALVLDVLESITIAPDDVWLWDGGRNNAGTPIFRSDRGEHTVGRFLGVAFGLIGPNDYGSFYPKPEYDALDMNPWHRVMRSALSPIGYPDRYRIKGTD